MSRGISVFGLGYVGTVTAACLAHQGNQVTGVDLNPAKVEAPENANSPIVEPVVADLIVEGRQAGRLQATIDSEKAVLETDITFLCVAYAEYAQRQAGLGTRWVGLPGDWKRPPEERFLSSRSVAQYRAAGYGRVGGCAGLGENQRETNGKRFWGLCES